MDLQQLRYFTAAARLGGFTRAATACGVSQPTLSQQIAKLEGELGKPLFVRAGGGVTLTDAGAALRERADRILALAEDALTCVATDPDRGRLTVAAIPTVCPYLLPAATVRFAGQFPKARLDVREATTADLLHQMRAGTLDLGLIATPLADDGLTVQPLLTEPLLAALPEAHPLAAGEKVRMDRLAAEPFVLLHDAHCLTGQTVSFCAGRRLAPVATAEVQQLATVLELVRLGAGVSLVPAMAARPTPGVAFRPVAGDGPTRTVSAVWPRGRVRGTLFDGLLAALGPS
jgi:LysR family hydrogen peroxide-inducible transcriptional activator